MVLMPITGTSKRISWFGLAILTTVSAAAQGRGLAFQRLHDLSCAFDGRIGAFHGFDGDAGGLGDHHRLSDVVLRQMARDGAAIGRRSVFPLRWERGR